MKISAAQFANNRQLILEAAARLFKQRGFEAVTVSEVMGHAGLTHGAFYGYFESKTQLITQACTYALELDQAEMTQTIQAYLLGYLSSERCNDRALGCSFAALAGEAVRQPNDTRRALAEGLKRTLDALETLLPSGTANQRRTMAIASFSSMLGGVVLARMVDDPTLAEEILSANRETLMSLVAG